MAYRRDPAGGGIITEVWRWVGNSADPGEAPGE